MKQEELQVILEKHKKWLFGEDGGCHANLCHADLRDADLRRLDLNDALRMKAELEQIEAFRAQKKNEPVQEPVTVPTVEEQKVEPKAASGFAYVVKPISEKQEKALLDFLKGNGYEFRAEWR